MLRTGMPGKSALDLGRELLERFNGLTGLLEAPHAALRTVRGVGVAKATQLAAITELVRRALREEMRRGVSLSSPAAVRSFLKLNLATRDREVFVVIFLDAQNGVLAIEELFAGTLDQTNVYPREIVRRALQHNAAAVIFAQNIKFNLTYCPRKQCSRQWVRMGADVGAASSRCLLAARRGTAAGNTRCFRCVGKISREPLGRPRVPAKNGRGVDSFRLLVPNARAIAQSLALAPSWQTTR